MSTAYSWVDVLHVASAALSLVFSIGAPFTRPRHVKPSFWCCLLLAVLAWSSALLLFVEAGWRQQEPSLLSAYHTTLFAQAATLQLDQIYDNSSRVWDLYAWSWVVGCADQVFSIAYQLGTKQSFDIWSSLRLALAFLCLSASGLLLLSFAIGRKKGYESVQDEENATESPSVEGIAAAHDTNRQARLLQTAEKEIQDAGGVLEWMAKYKVFWPIIWPVGNPTCQLCLILAFAITMVLQSIEVLMAQNLGFLTDELRKADDWHDIYPSLQLWAGTRFMISRLALPVLRTFLWQKAMTYRQRRLQETVHERIMNLDSSYHLAVDPHDTINSADLGSGVDQALDSVFSTIVPSIATLFSAIPVIVRICGPWIVPALLNWVILYGIVTRRFATAMSRVYVRWLESLNINRRHNQDSIAGWKTLANFNQIASQISVGKQNALAHFTNVWAYLTKWFINEALHEVLLLLSFFLGVFLTIGRVIHGSITGGDFFTYVLCWGLLVTPIRLFKEEMKKFLKKLHETVRLRRILQMEPRVKKGKVLKFREGKVEFKNVKFRCGNNVVFEDFTHTFAPGTMTAIVGPTGCGKTTLFQLLMGHLSPESGNILIDGQDIADVDVDSVREHVGIMEQSPHLFNDTVRKNLMLANERATVEDVNNACLAAGFNEVVEKRLAGYETSVGANGQNLSGGQKKQLALAALFLERPKIVLLDEPTSALDSNTEALVKKNIDNEFKDRTRLISAHRLSTIRNAHHIIVLGKNGEIVESGTHESLLRKEGTYWTMWKRQIGK